MKIIFSKHAEERLAERRIHKKLVMETLLSPDWYRPTFKGRILVRKKMGALTVEAIYMEDEDAMIVITCYLL
jgi:hypothetical protein